MKSKKKDEDIDISTLPPWFPIACNLNFGTSKERSAKLIKALQTSTYETKKFITREEIINYGKEKNLYLDPITQADKLKKDKAAAEIPTELTPELLGKIFVHYYNDIVIQARKAKKDYQDAIAAGKDPHAKKDSKDGKGAKKGGKPGKTEEIIEEKPEEPPLDKQIEKLSDYIYFFTDYPTTKEEFAGLSKAGGAMDLILRVNEQVITRGSDSGSELLEGPEDGVEPEGDYLVEEKQQKLKEDQLTEDDKAFIQANNKVVLGMKAAREECGRNELLRNTVYKELLAVYDYSLLEEDMMKDIVFELFTQLALFSYDVQAYRDWIKTRKVEPLIPKDPPTAEELAAMEAQRLLELEEKKRQEEEAKSKKKGGKDSKKETKDAKKKEEEEKKEEILVTEEPVKEEKPVDLSYYNKQLGALDENSITPGLCLEALLDQINYTKLGYSEAANTTVQELQQIFSSMSQDLYDFTSTLKEAENQKSARNLEKKEPHKLLIDEIDEIQLRTYNNRLANEDSAEERERRTFDEINVPGIDRNNMPERPLKSEKLRKLEKSQMHPFVSNDVNDFERFLVLEEFEKLMKTKDPRKEWNFGDRVYEERYNKSGLRMKLYKTLLYEPDVLCQYYDKDDSLLVSTYYNKPPSRVLRKKWSCDWRTLPNLENWIRFFKGSENLNTNLFYDLDYRIVENLHERVKQMYPDDDSVIICGKFNVGSESSYHYRVVKENITFGLRNSANYGDKMAELWVKLENKTRILVEMEKNIPVVTEEERREAEERRRLAEEAAIERARLEEIARKEAEEKNKKGGKDIKKGKETKKGGKEEEKSPETLVEMPLETEPEIPETYSATLTLTLQNGLIVKYLANGDIVQTIVKSIPTSTYQQRQKNPVPLTSEEEINRVITGKGSVIKYLKDGTTRILYANGNTAELQSNGIWVTINNKGMRKGRKIKDNREIEYDPIPCASKTDPQTGCKVWIREDQVMVIKYPNGFQYTVHKDGTRFLIYPKKDTIIVEHDEFASVKVIYDKSKERAGTIIGTESSYYSYGFDNIMERSFDGRVTETYLPDGTKVVGFFERKEIEGHDSYEDSHVHLIYSADGSVVKTTEHGEVLLISANDRYELNLKGENRQENDIDYYLQLFCSPEERRSGVFTADLVEKALWTQDDENNRFLVTSSGEAKAYLSAPVNPEQNQYEKENIFDPEQRPGTPEFPDGEFVEPENEQLDLPKRHLQPKLFVINNDDTGSELLNSTQIRHYVQLQENNPKCRRIIEEVAASYQCQSITYLTELQTLDEMKTYLVNVDIPENIDIIPKVEKKRERPTLIKFTLRNFLQYTELDEQSREILQQDKAAFEAWKAARKNEFGQKPRTDEEREKEYQILVKITEARRKHIHKETHDEKFENVSTMNLKQIWDEMEHFMDTRETDKLADVMVTIDAPPKKKEKKEKPKVIPTRVTYDIWGEEIEPNQIDRNLKSEKNEFVANYYGTYVGEKFMLTLPEEDRNMIKQKKLEQRDREEFLKKTMSNMSMTSGSQREATATKQEGDDGSKPQTTIPQSQERPFPQGGMTADALKRTAQKTMSMSKTMEIALAQREIEEAKQAELIRKTRTKDFDVYGAERKTQENVACLARSSPLKELNAKYITVESGTERRVKISSLANRMHLHAPSVTSMRMQDDFHLMKKSLDKIYPIERLNDQKNLMMTAALSDNLKKDINILPATVDFGPIRKGGVFEYLVVVKNEDVIPQRITVKNLSVNESYERQYIAWKEVERKKRGDYDSAERPERIRQMKVPFRVDQKELGLLSMGISRELLVQLDTADLIPGEQFEARFEIWTRHDIYKIPLKALPLDPSNFEKKDIESRQASKRPLLKPVVKELRKDEKGRIRGYLNASDRKDLSDFMESGASDALPKLNFERNINLDPTALLRKNQKKDNDSYYDNQDDTIHS